MAPQSASTMAKSPAASHATRKSTLQSDLSNSRKSLAIINDERIALQKGIQRKIQEINQTITDYWVSQAKILQLAAEEIVDEREWRVQFATQETRWAKLAAEKQKSLWSQIDRMMREAKDQDHKFWATWQKSLDHLASPDEPTQQPSSSHAVKASHPPHAGERPTRRIAKKSAPQGPTALFAKRTRSIQVIQVKKASKPAAAEPSLPSSPPRITNPGRSATNASVANHNNSPARQEKKDRAPRRAAAKSSIKPPPVRALMPRKKRVNQPAKVPINSHPVTDPTPGQLYQAYYHSPSVKERGWYMGTVLPWKSSDWSEKTMIDMEMRDMDLLSDWPDCCQPGFKIETNLVDGKPIETKELTCIEKWMPGFEDGGPRVMERKFLFLFFEDRPRRLGCLDIDPTEPMALIQFKQTGGEPVPIDWVDAKYLRLNVADDEVVWGSSTAEKYRNKLDHVARLKEQVLTGFGALTSQQPSGALTGMNSSSLAPGSLDDTTRGHAEGGSVEGRFDRLTAIDGSFSGRTLGMASHVEAQIDKQQTGTTAPFSSTKYTGVLNGQGLWQKDQGNGHGNALSQIQPDIDEAYEEPQTYTKRTAGKRSLSNDLDEYDEGLGMDYDLSLKRSNTQMSRPQTFVMGVPPHKLPRLGDYKMSGPSSGGPGSRAGIGHSEADMSNFCPGSAVSHSATSSPTHGFT